MTTRTRRLERLTASEVFLLRWDGYGWSSDIGVLAALDSTDLLDAVGAETAPGLPLPATAVPG